MSLEQVVLPEFNSVGLAGEQDGGLQVVLHGSGNGIGRIYTINVRCTDAAGNVETIKSAVLTIDATGGWAVGTSGTIMRYAGGAWVSVASPTRRCHHDSTSKADGPTMKSA